MTAQSIDEYTRAVISAHAWERILVIGGLAVRDTEEVHSHLSRVDKFYREIGGRVKCVLHTCGRGVAMRASSWAQGSGVKQAPFNIAARGTKIGDGVKRVFEVGKPTIVLVFPGLPTQSIMLLGAAKVLATPVVNVDDLYPPLTKEDAKKLGGSYERLVRMSMPSVGRDCWNNGILNFKTSERDNTFQDVLKTPAQRAAFATAEKLFK